MRAILLGLAVATMGCSGDTTKTDTVTDDPVGTDAATDSVTDSETDTSSKDDPLTTGDTGTEIDATEVRFAITGAFEGTALTVRGLQLSTEPPSFGDVLAATTVTSATPSITLEGPFAADLIPFPNFEGVELATYVVALHTDGDGNERIGKGEVYTGVGGVLLAWINAPDGDLPGFLTLAGAVEGWNSFDLVANVIEGSEKGVLADLPITVRPLVDSFSISGTYDLDDAPGFALVPANALEYGRYPDELLFDGPMSAKWTIDVKGTPPTDNQIFGNPGLPDGSAVEYPFTYSDNDTNGSLGKGDNLLQQACDAKSGEFVQLWYLPPSDDLLINVLTDGRTGWLAAQSTQEVDAEPTFWDGPLTDLTLCEPVGE